MSYRINIFKADQHPGLCMDYSRNQIAVLSEYGCAGLKATKEKWMDNPNAWVVVAYDNRDNMVSGLRIQLHHNDFPLQITSTIDGLGKVMNSFRSESNDVTAEIYGLWTAKSIRDKGFELIMTQAATAIASQFGVTSLFSIASPKNSYMFKTLGYVGVESRDNEGGFMYPAGGYVSTVMVVPDAQTLEYANAAQRSRMLSIRENPSHTALEGSAHDLFIEYQLDEMIDYVPSTMKELMIAA